jgi:anti-anti-sigma regulatory factor
MVSGHPPKIIDLQGPLSIDRAASLKEELGSALGENDQVLVNLSLVEEIDLACLQVLYSARAQARVQGKELHLVGPVPSRVVGRLEACGVVKGSPERAEDLESALVGF